jgi:hypothetical protein
MSHKSGAIGELCYFAKRGKCKERNVANHAFPISSVGTFYLG